MSAADHAHVLTEWEDTGREEVRACLVGTCPLREVRPRGTSWLERANAGETLQSIGDDVGLTRERVRQVVTALAPHKPWRALATERRAVLEEVERSWLTVGEPRDCRVCGDRFETRRRKATCSPRCRVAWQTLMYAVSEERREGQRQAVARHVLRTGEGSRAFAENVLAGTVSERGRWILEGSATWRTAVEACREGWPIFNELPEPIQLRVRLAVENENERSET